MIVITEFGEHACAPDTSIRALLKRIDASPYLFQIVVDATGHLLGTVTDGDIRRAMLHGVGLDDPASACMQKAPITGRAGDVEGNLKKLANLGSSRSFLPVVDQSGLVCEILLGAGGEPAIKQALVMAGGPGTRLGTRTRTTPKPLLDVGGKPILEHVLANLENAAVPNIVVSVHYLADQIEAFVAQRPNRARIELVHEQHRLGTAGALRLLSTKMAREPVLIVNGDIITSVDFTALYDFHMRHGFDGTIAVARHEVDIPFGLVRYNDEGLFDRIEEKPRLTNFVAAGVYYLSPQFLALVPEGQPMDMPELLNLGKSIGLRTGLFPIHEYWTDVGRPDDLEAADRMIVSLREASK
jgi:dTDP-glucose pyrophosphorylase